MKTSDPTPIQKVAGGIYLKREDLFTIGPVNGGKARACVAIASGADTGLVSSGGRASTQHAIVAAVAAQRGVPCRLHTANGEVTPEMCAAADLGAEVIQHKAGYTSVLKARARDDARERGWRLIPMAMATRVGVDTTRRQVQGVPKKVKRVVIAVGSGTNVSGVLWGLRDLGLQIPVLGLVIGSDPTKHLDVLAPPNWRQQLNLATVPIKYAEARVAEVGGVSLDPIYEAKCADYLQKGDLFWIIGKRTTSKKERN